MAVLLAIRSVAPRKISQTALSNLIVDKCASVYREPLYRHDATRRCRPSPVLSSVWTNRIRSMAENTTILERGFQISPLLDRPTGKTVEEAYLELHQAGAQLGVQAIAGAITASGLDPPDFGRLWVHNTTPGCPGTGPLIRQHLGLPKTVTMRQLAASGCSGGGELLEVLHDHLQHRKAAAALGCATEVGGSMLFGEQFHTLLVNAVHQDAALQLDARSLQVPPTDSFLQTCRDAERAFIAALPPLMLVGDAAVAIAAVSTAHEAAQGVVLPHVVACHSLAADKEMEGIVFGNTHGIGLRMHLGIEVPNVGGPLMLQCCNELLSRCGLKASQIDRFAIHCGGPTIVPSFAKALGEPWFKFQKSADSLANRGNCMSASMLDVLARVINEDKLTEGQRIVAGCIGPKRVEFALIEYRRS